METIDTVEQQPNAGYKLMSYNTSWVLDCHENQIDDNNFLSESAAIIAKMKVINKKVTYAELLNDRNYKDDLNEFRMALADKATDYVKSKVDDKYDFIALIEQSMHVPENDHANYDPIMKNIFDLETATADNNTKTTQKKKVITYNEKKQNEEYGFLRRMKQLEIDKDNGNDTYNVAYDNGLNGANRAGEGIAILYNKSLVEKKLEWDQKENPAWKFIKKNAGTLYKDIKDEEITQVNNNLANKPPVNFCSDDLGPTICYENPNAESPKLVYSRKNGTSDEGRPIIITGGVVAKKILNLFIAAHGANIMNLCVYNVDEGKTQTNLVSKLENKDSLFAKLSGAITNFIKSAIESVSNQEILTEVEKVNIFLGGDFNDAKGFILRGLLENGIPLKVGNFDGTVNFNYAKFKSKNSNNKENYPSIFSCCANCDSVIGGQDVGTLGPIIPSDSDDTEKLITRLGKYPPDFILQQNFANNGDYALFGSSYDKTEYDLILEQDDNSHAYVVGDKSVMASDHVPVISSIASSEETVSPVSSTEQQLGGKRFRKRQTTYRKKHRSASSRSRRSSTRRSSSSSFHSIRLGKGKTNKSLCLDVEGGSHGKGARFIAWPCHGGPNQKFRVMKTRKGRKCLQAKHSRHCLDEKTFQQGKCPK
jgi:hypothetical protein